jgi:hypothetical protein
MTMFMIFFHRLARLGFVAGLATALLLAATAADTAAAATRKLSGTYSSGQITSACGAAGGVNYTIRGGGYGCATEQGKVDCNKQGKCTGTCSKCANVLKGVGGVLHPPASAGTAAAAGGTASKKTPVNNVNQPVAVQHAGHSGGTKH